jgi:carbamate kinase
VEHKGKLTGVAAVIDKDRASALLAVKLKVSHLAISTAVEKVYLDFGTPRQRAVDVITVQEAELYLEEGHFKAGSMRPKIEASLEFLRGGGTEVLITTPENLRAGLRGTAGTRIVHGR